MSITAPGGTSVKSPPFPVGPSAELRLSLALALHPSATELVSVALKYISDEFYEAEVARFDIPPGRIA